MSQLKLVLKKLNVEEFKKTGKIEFLDNVHVSNIVLVNEKKIACSVCFYSCIAWDHWLWRYFGQTKKRKQKNLEYSSDFSVHIHLNAFGCGKWVRERERKFNWKIGKTNADQNEYKWIKSLK